MPWWPELFSAPALQRAEEKWQRELDTVPFFDGLLAGEFDALIGSFAGEPELHHPVRGRIRGARAFETYVTETNAWLRTPLVRLARKSESESRLARRPAPSHSPISRAPLRRPSGRGDGSALSYALA